MECTQLLILSPIGLDMHQIVELAAKKWRRNGKRQDLFHGCRGKPRRSDGWSKVIDPVLPTRCPKILSLGEEVSIVFEIRKVVE